MQKKAQNKLATLLLAERGQQVTVCCAMDAIGNKATKHNPVWLLCDNHESHISVEGLFYASANGVFMLSFNPSKAMALYETQIWLYIPIPIQ